MRSFRATLAVALLAVGGTAGLTVTPATAAPATTTATSAVLVADVPLAARGAGTSVVYYGSLRVDDGTTVTCLTGSVTGANGRVKVTTTYRVTAGTTYGISAWETGQCSVFIPGANRWSQSLGGVTVTPTAGDVAGGTYQVTIP
jgi:hypothetical protein